MGGFINGSFYMNPISINTERLSRIPIINKDPYRYILGKKEFSRAFHRIKRTLFSGTIVLGYIYYHIRYHNELRSVKAMKFTQIQMMQVIPRIMLLGLITYPIGLWLFKDWIKLENHEIALIELKKFDREYFTDDEYKYAFLKKPIYKNEDSNYGRLYKLRFAFTYLQEAGWIRRRRESNPCIAQELPPKYDFTPKGPLAGLNFYKLLQQTPPLIGNNRFT